MMQASLTVPVISSLYHLVIIVVVFARNLNNCNLVFASLFLTDHRRGFQYYMLHGWFLVVPMEVSKKHCPGL